MEDVDDLRRKQDALTAGARHVQPMLDITGDRIAAHRRQAVVAADALIDLPHLRQLQLGVELRLSNKDNLQPALAAEGV